VTALDDHAEPDFVALAKGLIPLADAHAEAAEERGALADEVVEALHATGLWAIWVPRPLGGAELAPVPSLETRRSRRCSAESACSSMPAPGPSPARRCPPTAAFS
jgi:hypothetical protein